MLFLSINNWPIRRRDTTIQTLADWSILVDRIFSCQSIIVQSAGMILLFKWLVIGLFLLTDVIPVNQ